MGNCFETVKFHFKGGSQKDCFGNLNPVKVAMIVLPFYKTLNNKKHNEDGEEVDGEENNRFDK
jgi:hypothetical protein